MQLEVESLTKLLTAQEIREVLGFMNNFWQIDQSVKVCAKTMYQWLRRGYYFFCYTWFVEYGCWNESDPAFKHIDFIFLSIENNIGGYEVYSL